MRRADSSEMEKLRQEFEIYNESKSFSSSQENAKSIIDLKHILDSLTSSNTQKRGETVTQNTKSVVYFKSNMPSFVEEAPSLHFNDFAEEDPHRMSMLQCLVNEEMNAKMTKRLQSVLDNLESVGKRLEDEEWRYQSIQHRSAILREDLKLRQSQICGFRQIKSLIDVKYSEVRTLKMQSVNRNEEAQIELDVLQSFLYEAQQKQIGKIESMEERKTSQIKEAELLSKLTLKNKEKIENKEKRLAKLKEKATKLSEDFRNKEGAKESLQIAHNLLEIMKELNNMINRPKVKEAVVVESPNNRQEMIEAKSKSPSANSKFKTQMTRGIMAMNLFRQTSKMDLVGIKENILNEYKNKVFEISHQKKRYMDLVESLRLQKLQLKKQEGLLHEMVANDANDHKNDKEYPAYEFSPQFQARHGIKYDASEAQGAQELYHETEDEVVSYNDLVYQYNLLKETKSDSAFKEKIESATGFMLSGILLMVTTDTKLAESLEYIETLGYQHPDLLLVINRLKDVIADVKTRLNKERITQAIKGDKDGLEPNSSGPEDKKNQKRFSKRVQNLEFSSGNALKLLKKESFEGNEPSLQKFEAMFPFMLETIGQEQLVKIRRGMDLTPFLQRISKTQPPIKTFAEFCQCFKKIMKESRNEVVAELLNDFNTLVSSFSYATHKIQNVMRSPLTLERQESMAMAKNIQRRSVAYRNHVGLTQVGITESSSSKGSGQRNAMFAVPTETGTSLGGRRENQILIHIEEDSKFNHDEMENSEYFEQMHSNERAKILEMQAKALEKDVVLPKTQYVSPSHHLYLQSFRPTYKLQQYVKEDFGKKIKDYSSQLATQIAGARIETEPSNKGKKPNGKAWSAQLVTPGKRNLQLEVLKGNRKSVHPTVSEHKEMLRSMNVPMYSTEGFKGARSTRTSTTKGFRDTFEFGTQQGRQARTPSGNFNFKVSRKSNAKSASKLSSHERATSGALNKDKSLFASEFFSSNLNVKSSFLTNEFAPKPVLISYN